PTSSLIVLCVVFFQAEDGIRDFHVTGVQTCALPIWASAEDFNLVITNAPGADAWPITAANFILLHRDPADPKRTADAKAFFEWALDNGQSQAEELHYVPLPAELVARIKDYWATEFAAAE